MMTIDTVAFEEMVPRSGFHIFSPILDSHDVRLDVPKGLDRLAASDDGGYWWCSKCGAVTLEHAEQCEKKNCPVREDLGIEDDDEDGE